MAQDLRFVHKDGGEGAVTLHLPMAAGRAAGVMTAIGKLGFDFDEQTRSESDRELLLRDTTTEEARPQ